MKENANKLQPQQIRSVFYASSSIEDILPPELIQHIVSFNHMKPMNIKAVNKTFKTLCDKSENIELKHRENEIKSKIGTTQNNQTWIVHPTRQILNEKEIKLGYKGPMNDLYTEDMKSGDTIIIHDGRYEINNYTFPTDKNFQMIGYGKNVILHGYIEEWKDKVFHLDTAKVYLKNLKLINCYTNVNNNSTLWMQDCCCEYRNEFIDEVCLIKVYENANLYVANCSFGKDTYGDSWSAIDFQSCGELSIINCKFECGGKNEYNPCIQIRHSNASKIRVIDNEFKFGIHYDAIDKIEL
eukprot:205544_1